jgi:hypothetical protein
MKPERSKITTLTTAGDGFARGHGFQSVERFSDEPPQVSASAVRLAAGSTLEMPFWKCH